MSSRLCDALPMLQRCIMLIFSNMVEYTFDVIMYDFSVVENSFDDCLMILHNMLQCYEEFNQVLNWEKCHFIVKVGIVFGHKIFEKWIEVDRAKIG